MMPPSFNRLPRKFTTVLIALGCVSSVVSYSAHCDQVIDKRTEALYYLSRELDPAFEKMLAISAAPHQLRDTAEVYVYKREIGYVQVQSGSNVLTCLVNRDAFLYGQRAFKPTCWDRNGDSYVQLILRLGRLIASGKSVAEIEKDIERAISGGEILPPKTTGVAYMLAGDVSVSQSGDSVLERLFDPHLMFYANGISSVDLGVTAEAYANNKTLPIVFDRGAGGSAFAYIITMVGLAQP